MFNCKLKCSAVCLYFTERFSCLFTFLLRWSAVCLHCHWNVQAFVYIFIEMFSCLFLILSNIQLFVYNFKSCILVSVNFETSLFTLILKWSAVYLYFIEMFSCLFTFCIKMFSCLSIFYRKVQLFVYILQKGSAVCLHFYWDDQLFVYSAIGMFKLIFTFSLRCSAICL